MIRKQFTLLLSLCMLFGALPQKVYAEETEPEEIIEETVPEETEETEITEEIPDEVQAEVPAEAAPQAAEEGSGEEVTGIPAEETLNEEAVIPEETAGPEALPEGTETEMPQETEAPEEEAVPAADVPDETVTPEAGEGILPEAPEETIEEPEELPEEAAPEAAQETEAPEEKADNETEKPAEASEPETGEETAVPQETAEAAEGPVEETVTETVSEPAQELIEEETEEENEAAEAPATLTVTLNANGGILDKELTGLTVNTEVYYQAVDEYYDYYIYSDQYYSEHVTRTGYMFGGWYRNKACSDGKEAEEYSSITIVSDLTLYAKWIPAWKVTFKANGGTFDNGETSVTDRIPKAENLSYCSYGDPARSGMAFEGWSTVKNDKSKVIDMDNYTLKSDLTLYAYWTESVSVTFKANGGAFSDGSYTITEYIPKNSLCDLAHMYNPERSGYVFGGWYTDPSLKEEYHAGSSYLLKKDITLYAKWSKYYNVNFDGNGKYAVNIYMDGTFYSDMASITVKVAKGTRLGDSSDVPFLSDIPGYADAGWYTDKACSAGKEVDPYTFIPEADTVLYVKWAKEYKVTFKGKGGLYEDGSTEYSVTVKQGSCVGEAPQFTHPAKTFGGWYLDSALTKRVTYVYGYVPTGNTTFYPKWISGVRLVFDANGGEYENGESTLDVFGKKGSELRYNIPYPERAGYVFMGWYTDKALQDAVEDPYFYKVSGPATLYAKWVKAVKITFDAGEGWFWHYDPETGNYVKKQKVSAYFGKGTCIEDGDPYYFHNIAGAKGSDDTDYMQAPSRSEKFMMFAGWYTDKALTKEFNFFTTKIKSSMTLYAKYVLTSDPSFVTVTVDPNGGRIAKNGSRKVSVEKGSYFFLGEDIIDAPAGKKLYGFTTVKNDASTLLSEYAVIKKNMTVYAYYKPVYKVILNGSGGFICDGSYKYGWVENCSPVKVFEVFANEGIRGLEKCSGGDEDCIVTNADGKIFRGWYSDKACKKFVTYDVTAYKFKKDMTLYAKWGAPTASGWKKTNGKWWYKLPNGYYYAGTFALIGANTYYFDASGYMVTGWKKIDGYWYWFAGSGAMAEGWKKISGKWYWFEGDGIMATGWQKIAGKWYYFASGGAMVTGWKKISGKWYYFLSGGAMATGWKKVSGKWYYFLSGGAMVTGWKKISGKWYYFLSGGQMVTGSRKIGAKTYQFSSDGVCLNP